VALVTPAQIDLIYNPVQTYGLDFATAVGRWGLRTEWAYTKTQNLDGSDPSIKNPFVFGVVGIERTFLDTLNVNVQVLYKHMDHFKNSDQFSAPMSFLNSQLKLNSLQSRETMTGYVTRISYKMLNDALEVEGAFVQWQPAGDYFIRPKVIYDLSNHFKWIAGAEIYKGNKDTFFGRISDNSSAFTEIRWYF